MSWYNLASAGAHGHVLKLRHTSLESEATSRALSDYFDSEDEIVVSVEISRLSDGSINFPLYADRARAIRSRETRSWILSAPRAIVARARGASHRS